MPAADPPPPDAARTHWRRTLRLTGALLLAWGLVSFGFAYAARELSFTFFGWPFAFWVAAQGAPLVYLVIVACYARRMQHLDRECGPPGDE